jgi:hypothetical protein
MDVKEIQCEGVDWMHLAQYMNHRWAHGNTVMKLLDPVADRIVASQQGLYSMESVN